MAGFTLIPHTSTPTGFGVRQRSNGTLRPLSKCCGKIMRSDRVACVGCGISWRDASFELHASLGNDVTLRADTELLEGWLRKVTGWPDLKMEVTR